MNSHKILIEKLIFGGQGLGQINNKMALVWNALPGEEVEAQIIKKKKNYFEAIARNIIKASPHREPPKEDHFLSCSPWQIMNWEEENKWKKEISLETYERIGNIKNVHIQIDHDDNQYGYRKKMEFSFTEDESGQISLSFFLRGAHRKVAIQGCVLADPAINQVANKIVAWLKQQSISAEILKSLVVRANQQGQVVAFLFIKTMMGFENYPELDDKFIGFHIYYSNPESPASVKNEIIYQSGQDYLVDNVKGIRFKYDVLSFFQINPAMFERVLDDIAKFLDKKKSIIDYYTGVGAIGLALADKINEAVLIDSDSKAIELAQVNIAGNDIKNCVAHVSPAEKLVEFITSDKIIIFDPPRVGLHRKVVNKVLAEKPSRIIYLSCNVSSQARDIALLNEEYKISFIKLYNFFPKTPHIEALCVLDKK